jgi:hypothetical protein
MCYSLCLQDMLTTQVSEAALQEQMRKVQADVARSFDAAEVEVYQRMKQFSVLLHTLQKEDDDMKMKIDELENTINKNHGDWQQVDADLSKQVSLRSSAPVVLLPHATCHKVQSVPRLLLIFESASCVSSHLVYYSLSFHDKHSILFSIPHPASDPGTPPLWYFSLLHSPARCA